MQKKYFVFVTCLYSILSFAQDFSNLWQGHFSYNNIKEVVKTEKSIYAASDNAVFRFDTDSNTIQEFTTINGLSGETISTIHFSEAYDLLVIGYENGLIEIVFSDDSNVLSVVDILEKVTIQPNNKNINHFQEHEETLYISTNFGISIFNLERLEFGDTYFIGNAGSQIKVNQTAIFNGYIYAACSNNNGLRKASITNPNLIDFQNWETLFTGSYLFVEENNSSLYTINSNRQIYDISNDLLSELFTYSDIPLDIKSDNQNTVVTTQNSVFIYDESFSLISQVLASGDYITEFTASSLINDSVYIGTEDFGILGTNLSNPFSFNEIHPDGPLMNVPFSINANSSGVWVTYGEYNIFFNPYPLNSRGFSHLKNDQWINTKFEETLSTRCLNSISINPANEDQIFISSFIDGLLEVNDEIPSILYNESNSSLEDIIGASNPSTDRDIRVGTSTFDQNGVLWLTNNRLQAPLKTYNPSSNQWNSYSFEGIIADGLNDELGYIDLTIDNNGTKWVGGHFNGLIGFNENNSPDIKNIVGGERNMPSDRVYALALDKRNQIWIGTDKGLRVLFNTSNFFEDDDIRVEEIIIEEDGIAKELLFQQFITDIKVDGSNNKWIGTADSGLFYFSSDGQNTIYHFTKDNSPLPTNTINDVSIDDTNGIVYIATSRGLVSFLSGSSSPFEDLTNAFAYPNPVRPNFNLIADKVKIKDISENVNIKITDIEGNLVAEAQSRVNLRHSGYNLEIDGGTAYWNGKNLANNVVASGVYLIMLSDLDTFETSVIKLMVVR